MNLLFSFVLIISGGLKALQTADVVCGLPILVLALVMCVSYIKCIKSAKDYDIVGTFDSNKSEDMEEIEYLTIKLARKLTGRIGSVINNKMEYLYFDSINHHFTRKLTNFI